MLQMKFELSVANGFNISLKEILFESVDDNRQRWTTAYPIGSPRAFGSGELRNIKSV